MNFVTTKLLNGALHQYYTFGAVLHFYNFDGETKVITINHGLKSKSEVAQSCLTLCDPMDCSLQGSSVRGIFQARLLEWVCHFLIQGIFPTQGLNLGPPAL